MGAVAGVACRCTSGYGTERVVLHAARRYGAFALAMVLSLASAIPIVFACRLPECARRRVPGFDTAFA